MTTQNGMVKKTTHTQGTTCPPVNASETNYDHYLKSDSKINAACPS